MHLSSSPAIWYAARASGVAAYVVLSIVVSLGLTLGKKAQSPRWPRFSIEEIHRFGGLLVGSLIGIHVLAIAIDSFLPFSLTQLLVPFTASYRPLWTGLGIAAAELLVALAITNHYRRRLPYRFWRRAHYLNFAVWAFASLHGLMGGTDRGAPWLAILYGALRRDRPHAAAVALRRARCTRVATAGAVTVVALPLLIVGPLSHRPPRWNAANIDEPLTGSVVRNGTQLKEIVSFVGQAPVRRSSSSAPISSWRPQRLESTSLQLEYLPSGDVCRGRVTNVEGESFSGTCRLPNGDERTIEASWIRTRPEPASTAAFSSGSNSRGRTGRGRGRRSSRSGRARGRPRHSTRSAPKRPWTTRASGIVSLRASSSSGAPPVPTATYTTPRCGRLRAYACKWPTNTILTPSCCTSGTMLRRRPGLSGRPRGSHGGWCQAAKRKQERLSQRLAGEAQLRRPGRDGRVGVEDDEPGVPPREAIPAFGAERVERLELGLPVVRLDVVVPERREPGRLAHHGRVRGEDVAVEQLLRALRDTRCRRR